MTFAESLAKVKAAAADADKSIVRDVAAMTVPGFYGLDPWLLAIIIGAIIADDPSPNPETDRRRPLEAWKPKVKAKLDEWRETAANEPAPPVTGPAVPAEPESTAIAPLSTITPRTIPAPVAEEVAVAPLPVLPRTTSITPIGVTVARPVAEQPIELPPPPPPPVLPPSTGMTGTLIPAPPPGMPEPLREAWIQAKVRAGEYARGLGSVIRQWPNDVEREAWQGEAIVTEVDAETRRAKRAAIRDLTAEAVEKRWTPEKLASELGHKTQEWSRNWTRIARTELQAAHNEGVAITALRADGDGARVARIPESNACADCKRLFLDEDGKPRIFTVAELAANGTNVGKPRSEWVASLWPLHPNCFLPETMVATSAGPMPIGNVLPGDVLAGGVVVSAVWRSSYQGKLARFLDLNHAVVATTEHLFATRKGWVKAEDLVGRDDLVCIPVERDGSLLVDGYANNVPPERQKHTPLARIGIGLSRGGVPVATIYLDGELYVGECQVDEHAADLVSGADMESAIFQCAQDIILVLRASPPGIASHAADDFLVRNNPAANSIMRSSRDGLSVLWRRVSHPPKHGFGLSKLLPPGGLNDADDHGTTDAVGLGYVENRFAVVEVPPHHVIGADVVDHTTGLTDSPDDGAISSVHEMTPDSGRAHADANRNLEEAKSLFKMEVCEFSDGDWILQSHYRSIADASFSTMETAGPIEVVTLTTSAGWFPLAGGLVAKNCRCGTIAIPNGMTLNDKGRLVAE